MALTLNGIAQGYVADRTTDLLRNEGFDQMLVEAGEWRSLGSQPDGTHWQVKLGMEGNIRMRLTNRALAVSAPLGTRFNESGEQGHILDSRSGRPGGKWRQVVVMAPGAALADALSIALCLLPEEKIVHIRQVWPDAEIRLLPVV